MSYRIPEAVHGFRVYNGANRIIGATGKIELPEFSHLTNTLNLAGMLGEYEAAVMGQVKSQKMDIPFAQIDETEYFKIIESSDDIVLRVSLQTRNMETNMVEMVPMKVTVRGNTIDFKLGTIEKGAMMDASITKEIHYIQIMINGKNCLELDKFNEKYVVNGKDMLEKVRGMM